MIVSMVMSRRKPSGKKQEKTSGLKGTGVTSPYLLSVFSTTLDWMGLLGQDDQLISVFIGHNSAKSVHMAAKKFASAFNEVDWNPTVRELLESYADGDPVDFSQVAIQLPEMTDFRRKILATVRKLGYGETVSYGDLARRAGHPRAARAVGTTMSTNRFPIIIPCHRVLAAGGKAGGYSSPAGIALKLRMLDMEADGAGSMATRTWRLP